MFCFIAFVLVLYCYYGYQIGPFGLKQKTHTHTHIAHNNTQSAGSQQSLPVRESNVYKMYYIQLEKMPANKRWRYKQNSCLKVSIFNWICSGQDWKILWIYG